MLYFNISVHLLHSMCLLSMDACILSLQYTINVRCVCCILWWIMYSLYLLLLCRCSDHAQTRRNILQGLQEARSKLQRLQEDPNAKYMIVYCILYSKEFLRPANFPCFENFIPASKFISWIFAIICNNCSLNFQQS